MNASPPLTSMRRTTPPIFPLVTLARQSLNRPAISNSPRTTQTMTGSAFEALVRAHSSDLFRFAYWLCRNRWQSQDLVQETLANAWERRDSLRDKNAAKAWLFSILRNEHVQIYRKKHLDLVDLELEDLPVAGDNREIERMEIDECLRALPETYREPLLLYEIGGFSGKEIAAILKISESNVMTRLKRARQALRKANCGASTSSVVLPNYRNIPSPAQRGRARVGADLVTSRKACPHPNLPPQAGEGVYSALAHISSKQDEALH
jgi:RNA polymerase sigma-70 factor, ECF subfamily